MRDTTVGVRKIPSSSWASFLDSFSSQHHGWLVTVTRAEQHLADDAPFDFARLEGEAVVVSAGGRIVRVEKPSEISVAAAGADQSAIGHVAISTPRETLTIRFRSVVAPELVDGVAP